MIARLLKLGAKLLLGVAFLFAGGAVLIWNAINIGRALSAANPGLPLLNLIGLVLGLAGFGASADCFGLWRRSEPLAKTRNTKVFGAAEPASEIDAKAAANGETKAPLHDQTFSD